MRHDIELAYLGMAVPDPMALSEFFGETIGLSPGEPAGDGTLTWRNDDAAHRILVRPGPDRDATFIGFEAAGEAAFDATAGRLRGAGFELSVGTDEERKARRRVWFGRLLRGACQPNWCWGSRKRPPRTHHR